MQGGTNSLRMFVTAVNVLKMCQPAPKVPWSTIHVLYTKLQKESVAKVTVVKVALSLKLLSVKRWRQHTNGC